MRRHRHQLPMRVVDLLRDEKAATAIEYALIATLLSISIIAGLATLSTSLVAALDNIANVLAGL